MPTFTERFLNVLAAFTLAVVLWLCLADKASAAAPANDDFANAAVLSGPTDNTLNFESTSEPGEPNHAGNASGHSVWWRWTAPANGSVQVDTCGSYAIDTVLAVYTGDAVDALSEVASNDDLANCVPGSAVTFTASAGTTYHIAVDGAAGSASAGYVLLALRYCATGDCFAPKLFFDSYPGAERNDTSPSLSFHAIDANTPVSFQCEFWDGPSHISVPCSSPYDIPYDTPGADLADGNYVVRVTATDAVGNETRGFYITFTIDTVPPDTVIDSAPSGTTSDNTPTLSFHSTDPGVGLFTCAVDGGPPLTCWSPATFGPLADGPHTITVRANDGAGNVDPSAETASFTISSQAPPGTTTPLPAGPEPPRATTPAKNKCKKHPKGSKKRKRCIKKANRLPV